MLRRSPRKPQNTAPASKTGKTISDTPATTEAKHTTGVKSKITKVISKIVNGIQPTPKTSVSAAKRKAPQEDNDESGSEEVERKTVKRRKTRTPKVKDANMKPLSERTAVDSLKKAMYIGAHISAAGGVHNSVTNAVHIGANSFALFLKSQRKWSNPPLADEVRDQYLSLAKEHCYDSKQHVLPHGSYLVNLAQPEQERADQAFAAFVDDLKRCEALGIKLYNFHPGNSGGDSKDAACRRIAQQLNRAHKATKSVVTVLENMAGTGNVIGSRFEELRDIIANVDDKNRVAVCLDTCHTFAAGYDLRTPDAFAKTMEAFDKTVGMKYLKAFHLNDSKAPFASNRDLHANIGTGFLGLRAFHNIMNHAPFQGLPMVLETPIDVKGPDGKTIEDKQIWADEIKLLEGLIGMDPETDAFRAKEVELQAKGESEREKFQGQADRRAAKVAKKGSKPRKKKEVVESDEESD